MKINNIKTAKKLIKIAKQILSGGKPINRQTEFFKKLIHIGTRSGRNTYKDKKGYYYQWDTLHGQWQMYSKLGEHLGVLTEEGKYKKPSKRGRKISL